MHEKTTSPDKKPPSFEKPSVLYSSGCIALAGIFMAVSIVVSNVGEYRGLLMVDFFSVGKGNATFIESPSGNKVLVDMESDMTLDRRIGMVMPFYDRTIDVVIATNPDANHSTGLLDVLGRYASSNVISAWDTPQGSEIDLGDGTVVTIISPHAISIRYGGRSILLLSDIKVGTEKEILASNQNIKADFLDIGGSASKNSLTAKLLSAVNPRSVIISANGPGRYNTSDETLALLAEKQISYYRIEGHERLELIVDQYGSFQFSNF